MPPLYAISFTDDEGLLLAVALEQFADQSRMALATVVDPAARRHVAGQIAMADSLLQRVNEARR